MPMGCVVGRGCYAAPSQASSAWAGERERMRRLRAWWDPERDERRSEVLSCDLDDLEAQVSSNASTIATAREPDV